MAHHKIEHMNICMHSCMHGRQKNDTNAQHLRNTIISRFHGKYSGKRTDAVMLCNYTICTTTKSHTLKSKYHNGVAGFILSLLFFCHVALFPRTHTIHGFQDYAMP
jgi:hypothetical protein